MNNHNFYLYVPVVVLSNAVNKGQTVGQQTTQTNSATLTFPNNPSGAVSSATVITTNIEPKLALSKTISPAIADAGDTLTVTLVANYPVSNAASSESAGVVVDEAGNYVVLEDNGSALHMFSITPAGVVTPIPLSGATATTCSGHHQPMT